MLNLIGFMGKAGSGKDTAADILVREFGFTKESLAAPMKRGLAAMLDLPEEAMNNRIDREKPYLHYEVSIRRMLQTLGTDWGRNMVHEDIWVDNLMRRHSRNRNTVVSDVRFENEAKRIKKAGGIVVALIRPENREIVPQHSSENMPMHLANFVITNGGDLDSFEAEIRAFAKTMLEAGDGA